MPSTKTSEIPERLKKALDGIYADLLMKQFARALATRRRLQEDMRERSEDYEVSSLLNIINELSHPIYQAISTETRAIRELLMSHRFKEASSRLQPLTAIAEELSRERSFLPLVPEISTLEKSLPVQRSQYLEKKREEINHITKSSDVSQSITRFLEIFDELERSGLLALAANDLQRAIGILEERGRESYSSPSRFIFRDTKTQQPLEARITPSYLSQHIVPYLQAIVELQHIVDSARGKPLTEVAIRSISQSSPITVNVDGVAEAIKLIQEMTLPWKRQHAETMDRLAEQEKQVEIQSKRAEILQGRQHAEKERMEVAKLREETERLRLENEKLRLELHHAKIRLALDILNEVAPRLSETERADYLIRLLPPLDVLIVSTFEISPDTPTSGG